jgi:hypothetical protein
MQTFFREYFRDGRTAMPHAAAAIRAYARVCARSDKKKGDPKVAL